MRNFGYDVSVGMEVGKAEQLLGRGVFGKSRSSVAFGNPRFSGW